MKIQKQSMQQMTYRITETHILELFCNTSFWSSIEFIWTGIFWFEFFHSKSKSHTHPCSYGFYSILEEV